jgi:hypothetical protein
MSAGLPAVGLGGALYLLLIIWMLLRELTGITNGSSSECSRWPFIGKMVFVSLAMVLVILVERLVIKNALQLVVLYIPALAKFTMVPSGLFVLLMAAMPFVILLVLIACLHCLRFSRRLSKTQPQGRARFARREATQAILSEGLPIKCAL